MATNNEMAAFEDFAFGIGDIVRSITERKASQVTVEEADRVNAESVRVTPMIGMVMDRWLGQDEAGISRFYTVKGVEFCEMFKEFELELV